MIADDAHDDVVDTINDLVAAVRERPNELPIAELARVHGHRVDVEITRADGEAVAIVTPRPDPAFDRLTRREREVATLVCAGYSNAQIASTLFISLATVKDHVHSILATTGFESRAQLIVAWFGGTPGTA